MTAAPVHFATIDALTAYSKLCAFYERNTHECADMCKLTKDKFHNVAKSGDCTSLKKNSTVPEQFIDECFKRASGELVWGGASQIMLGLTALTSVTVALF